MVSADVDEVASVCGEASSAWQATCALFERAASLGVDRDDRVDGGNWEEAERDRPGLPLGPTAAGLAPSPDSSGWRRSDDADFCR